MVNDMPPLKIRRLEGKDIVESSSSSAASDGSPLPHSLILPPEVWANVIDFLPYDSLRSCAQTSHAILHNALPLVTTLNIENASQLRIGIVSNHLRDLRSVKICNLFQKNSESNSIQTNDDIATKSAHFLSRFPYLEFVSFWGEDGDSLCSLSFDWTFDDSRVNHLMSSLSGAFGCGSLPHNLQIIGLSCPKRITSSRRDCRACNRVCKMFPLEHVGDVDLCLPYSTSNELIESRKGGRNYLHSETRLLQLLGKGRVDELRGDTTIIKYDSIVRDELKNMVESSQLDITTLNQEDVLSAITRHFHNNISVYLSEESFDYSKAIGVPINNDLLNPRAVRVENLDRMVKHIMEEMDISQESVKQLSSLLSKKRDTTQHAQLVQLVVESGVLPKLVEFLSIDSDSDLQLATTDILLNVAALGETEHVEEIVKLGAVPSFVHLLSSSRRLPLFAAWALGNISGKNPHFRDLVLQAGVLQPLLKLYEDHQTLSDLESVRTYTFLLSNLCRGKPKPDFNVVRRSLSVLKGLIYHLDEEVVVDACWTLSYLSDGPYENNQVVIDSLGSADIPQLIRLLKHSNKKIQTPALRIVGNIVTGTNAQIQQLIDNNALPCLLYLLSSSSKDLLIEACWVMSNIAAGTPDQKQAIIDSGFITKVISLLRDTPLLRQQIVLKEGELFTAAVEHLRKEVAWVLSNVSQGSAKQVKYLINQGCIPILFDMLSIESDARRACLVLLGIENMLNVESKEATIDGVNRAKLFLEANGRSKIIEGLLQHDNDEVRKLSTDILVKYSR